MAAQKKTRNSIFWPVSLSLVLQIGLGLFFGHAYDQRIYMATGYLVGTGQNPYIPQDLVSVFHNSAFQGMTSVGYPPPWPLVTGLVYFLTYRLFPNFLLYNLALKLPILAANIALAFLVKDNLEKMGASPQACRRAWIFMLFNPFILVVTSAWGQFDSIVALLALLAILFLAENRRIVSAVLLALAIAFKPTALPLLLAAFLFLFGCRWRKLLAYFGILFLSLIVFCVGPFWVFHWDASIILHHWNAQVSVGGGMSFMTFLELVISSYQLPGLWWLLGLLWAPALVLSALRLPGGGKDLPDLLLKSAVMILIFFLFRTWLSEPNLILILPILVILASTGKLDQRLLTAFWIVPLIFSLFNTSLTQLLFPSLPDLMNRLLSETTVLRVIRLALRILLVIPWLWLEGTIILRLWRQNPLPSEIWDWLATKVRLRKAMPS